MDLKPYDPEAFNRLPPISRAVGAFDARGGDALVAGQFRNLFLHHRMDRTFGLILLHRHFDLDDHERLVEYRGTSVPWCLGKATRAIRPSNWLLSHDGAVRPYEFHFSPASVSTDPDFVEPSLQAFLADFASLLTEHSVWDLFGLCKYPGDDFTGRVEITEGRANINLKPEDCPADIQSRTAAWFFSPPLWNFKCNCLCRYEGSSHSGEHKGHQEST